MPKKTTPKPEETPDRRKPLKRSRIGGSSITIQHSGSAFMVCVNHADGKRTRQRCATQAEAEVAYTLKLCEAERVGVNVAASIQDEDRVAVANFRERTASWSQRPSIATVLQEYIDRHDRQNSNQTFSEALAKRVEEAEARGTTARHVINVKSRLRTFVAAHGSTPIGDLTSDQISKFINSMPVSARSRADTLNDISSVLAAAVRAGKLERNPAATIRPPKVAAPETGIISADELARLLAALPDRSVAAVAVMAFAGLRRSEAEKLEWANVRLAESVIVVSAGTSKTGARRTVPIVPVLHQWLAPRLKENGTVAPLPMTFRRDLESSRVTAKITTWPRNALRHVAASVWVAVEQDIGRVSAWLGHDPKVLHRHYKNLISREQAAAWLAVAPPAAKARTRKPKAQAKVKAAQPAEPTPTAG